MLPIARKLRLHGKGYSIWRCFSTLTEKDYEKEFFASELIESERRSWGSTYNVRYPMVASSSGTTDYYEKKFTLYLHRLHGQKLMQVLPSMVVDYSQLILQEQSLYFQNLQELAVDGFDIMDNRVQYAWLGATDDPNQFAHGLEFE